MEDKITLDRDTFKALAIDSRVNILKLLDERYQLTLSDLAEELGMAPSTIKEHLDKLVSSGLIAPVDKGTKWKYYRLTSKGKKILNPHEKKVWIILSASIIFLSGALYSLLERMQSLAEEIPAVGGSGYRDVATLSDDANSGVVAKAFEQPPPDGLLESAAPQALESVQNLPYLELLLVIVLVLVAGICVGYLIKRKRIF